MNVSPYLNFDGNCAEAMAFYAQVFQGTIVASGLAICEVTTIGNKTQLGKIGSSLNAIEEEKTPLQIQIGNFVTKMSKIGRAHV
mgnify:CR=1 FL=1